MPAHRTCECGACRKCKQRLYMREWTARVGYKPKPEKNRAANRAYNQANREAYSARRKVERAVRLGRLIRQPCEACGSERVHAHHDDYSKPLEVRWLCPIHHADAHSEVAS